MTMAKSGGEPPRVFPLPILLWQQQRIWGARLRQMFPDLAAALVEIESGDPCEYLSASTIGGATRTGHQAGGITSHFVHTRQPVPPAAVLVEIGPQDVHRRLATMWELHRWAPQVCIVALADRSWNTWKWFLREAGAQYVCFSSVDLLQAARLLRRWARWIAPAEKCTAIGVEICNR